MGKLESCKMCSKLLFTEERYTFSNCTHALCGACKNKDKADSSQCSHCSIETTMTRNKAEKQKQKENFGISGKMTYSF